MLRDSRREGCVVDGVRQLDQPALRRLLSAERIAPNSAWSASGS
jgi:hypothetical protein